MKILHIEDWFHPQTGYQLNLLSKYQVKQGNEVIIFTSDLLKGNKVLNDFFGVDNLIAKDRGFYENTGVEIYRMSTRYYISGRMIFKYRELINKIKQLKPDILFVHGNDTFTGIVFTMLCGFNRLKIPLVLDSHMLEMATVNRFTKIFRVIYKKFITPVIKRKNILVIRTQNDSYVEKCLGIPLEQSPWVSVGTDTTLFKPDENVKKNMRNKYKIDKDDFVIIYAGKLDKAKGGMFLAETFIDKFATDKKIVLIVIGNTNDENGNNVRNILETSENEVLIFPTQSYMNLPKYYQMSDLAIFPKQCSLSFYDVQACGLPVVSEDNNVNIERNFHMNGFCFREGDSRNFRENIEKCINMNKEEYEKMSSNAAEFVRNTYDYKYIAKQYTELIENEKNKFENFNVLCNKSN